MTAAADQVSIVVQPPRYAAVNTILYPSVTARSFVDSGSGSSDNDFSSVCACAVLLDFNGQVLESQLQGTLVVAPVDMVHSSGSSSSGGSSSSSSNGRLYLYFTFYDLSVEYAGNYSIRVDIYFLEPTEARVIQQVETRPFEVFEADQQVWAERGAPAERRVLRALRPRNYNIPASPV